jgi:hypothetical protein
MSVPRRPRGGKCRLLDAGAGFEAIVTDADAAIIHMDERDSRITRYTEHSLAMRLEGRHERVRDTPLSLAVPTILAMKPWRSPSRPARTRRTFLRSE